MCGFCLLISSQQPSTLPTNSSACIYLSTYLNRLNAYYMSTTVEPDAPFPEGVQQGQRR